MVAVKDFFERYWLLVGFWAALVAIFVVGMGSRYANVVYLLLIVPALVHLLIARPFDLNKLSISDWLLAGLLLLYAINGLLLSSDPKEWVVAVLVISLWLYLADWFYRNHQQNLLMIYLSAAIVVAFFAGWSVFKVYVIDGVEIIYRQNELNLLGISGQYLHQSIIAFMYGGLAALLISSFFTLRLPLWVRGLIVFALLQFAAALFFSYTRTAGVALLGSMGVLILCHRNWLNKWALLVAPIAIGVVAALYSERLAYEIFERGDAYRLGIWQGIIQDSLAAPWLGHGVGAPITGQHHQHAHNVFLTVFYELGLPGLLLFIGFVVSLIVQLLRRVSDDHRALILLSGVIYFVIIAMISWDHIIDKPGRTWMVWWFPVGIALALLRRPELVASANQPKPPSAYGYSFVVGIAVATMIAGVAGYQIGSRWL